MATDINTLLADLERLKAARRSGTLKIRFEDHEVTYRSDVELAAEIQALEAEVLGGSGPRNVVVRAKKGWA
jgi:hypothetical protein